MLRVWVCAVHMGGFLGQNSLNSGPFYGRFSLKMGGIFRDWQKIVKMGSSLSKFIIKVGMMATIGN